MTEALDMTSDSIRYFEAVIPKMNKNDLASLVLEAFKIEERNNEEKCSENKS